MTEQLKNPFIDAMEKWDELNRQLMLVRDELAQQKEENARLNNALVEADAEIERVKADHDRAVNEMMSKHSADLAAKDETVAGKNETVATLTHERDVFKMLSIQQTVRLRDFGEAALRIVQDSRVATMGDPALERYAKPLVPPKIEELSPEDAKLLSSITGIAAAA